MAHESACMRRAFVKGAGVAAAAFALPLATQSPAEAAEVAATDAQAGEVAPAVEPVASYTADVVVMGAGISGLCAALEAAQLGAGVVLLERTGGLGGGGRGTEGVFAVGSALQEAAGINVEPVQVVQNELGYHHNRVDGGRWVELIRKSGDNIQWLIDNGVEFTGQVDSYRGGDLETFHWFGSSRAMGSFVPQMEAAVRGAGVTVLKNTRATNLILGGDGAVAGLYAEKLDGSVIAVNAQAVILAGGGFANNDEYVRRLGFNLDHLSRPYHGYDGDAIRMAKSVGGADSLDRAANMMLPCVAHSLYNGSGIMGPGNDGVVCAARNAKSLWVDETGLRVVAENPGAANYQAFAIPLLFHDALFSIFDQNVFTTVYEGMKSPFVGAEENQAEIDRMVEENLDGDCFRADTLDELVEQAAAAIPTIDRDTLLESVSRYNQLCDLGEDDDFAKPAESMVKLENPPFYFMRLIPHLCVTFGGVHTNRQFQCLREDGSGPVAGLYAVGSDSAELWPNIYTLNVPGGANANNINSGRTAARHAVAEIGEGSLGGGLLGGVTVEGDETPSLPNLSRATPESLTDGEYTATGTGLNGDIAVTVVIEGGKIASVTQSSHDTAYVGVYAMENKIIPAIVAAGSLDIDVDVIGGATASGVGLCNAVEECLAQAANA